MVAKQVDPDLLRRGIDFRVFVEEICGIRLNPAQQRIYRHLQVGPDRMWPFKDMEIVSANQVGKTLITACIILWACMYKVGKDPDPITWIKAPYLWLHLGPVQQQAYHAYKDMKLIIRNEHPAQGERGNFPTAMVSETKVEKYYDGYVFWNGAEAHFRTGENKAEAILGYRAAGISVDEAAFLDHLSDVVNEVLYMRLIASKGPLFLISTPNGMNDYFDIVDEIQSLGSRVEDMVWHWDDKRLVWAVVADNAGYGIDQEEIDRMERTINPATKEQQLRGAFLQPLDVFFQPADKILDAFRHDLPDHQDPIPGHTYEIFWDPSISSDPTAAIVLDTTFTPWVGVHHEWFQKPLDAAGLVGEMFSLHRTYHGYWDINVIPRVASKATTGYDATSMGGALMRKLVAKIRPQRPINFGGNAQKVPMLTDLRALLTTGKIILPASWKPVRQEILNYKLKDDKIRQDNVMALMGASVLGKSRNTMGKQQKADVSARTTPRRRLTWA